MDTSNNVGKPLSQGEFFCDTDVYREEFADECLERWYRAGFFKTPAFAALVKAITRRDRALEDQILRLWGIR